MVKNKKTITKKIYLFLLLVGFGIIVILFRQNKPTSNVDLVITPTKTTQLKSTINPSSVIIQDNAGEQAINGGLNLEVQLPVEGNVFNTSKITVKGKTSPNADVFINDLELKADSSGNFSTLFNLEEGENYLIIAANDSNGNYAEKEIMVILETQTYD